MVPSVQIKTGPVTANLKEEEVDDDDNGAGGNGAIIKRARRAKATLKKSRYFIEDEVAKTKGGKRKAAVKQKVEMKTRGSLQMWSLRAQRRRSEGVLLDNWYPRAGL